MTIASTACSVMSPSTIWIRIRASCTFRPVSLNDWILALHLLAAFALVAAEVLFTILIVALWRSDSPSRIRHERDEREQQTSHLGDSWESGEDDARDCRRGRSKNESKASGSSGRSRSRAPARSAARGRARCCSRSCSRPTRRSRRERLIDAVWPDDPPESARHALQVYLSTLRKAIGPERIVTEPAGYRIVVAEDELDALALPPRRPRAARLPTRSRSGAARSRAPTPPPPSSRRCASRRRRTTSTPSPTSPSSSATRASTRTASARTAS